MLFEQAQVRHSGGDFAAAIVLARGAINADASRTAALEYLATVLITRLGEYNEGLDLIERSVELGQEDAGLWYACGWLYEFVAHEARRRPTTKLHRPPKTLYQRARDAFKRCLDLRPDGKLKDDAEDLLDHVENELASM